MRGLRGATVSRPKRRRTRWWNLLLACHGCFARTLRLFVSHEEGIYDALALQGWRFNGASLMICPACRRKADEERRRAWLRLPSTKTAAAGRYTDSRAYTGRELSERSRGEDPGEG